LDRQFWQEETLAGTDEETWMNLEFSDGLKQSRIAARAMGMP
jgi:hypothetical protein